MSHEIDVKFDTYDRRNPKVYQLFKRFAYEALMTGHRHFGAKAIMERVRWETIINTTGDQFKVNNNYTSRYVRKLITEKPEFEGFFRVHKLLSRPDA